MKFLDELKQLQPQILLAEIAGLLHNIGKLDPNFLAAHVENQGDSKADVRNHSQEISDYSYSRFSTIDPNLFTAGIKDIVTRQPWRSANGFLNEADCFDEITAQLRRRILSCWDGIEADLFIEEVRNANPNNIDLKNITQRMPLQKGKLDALLQVAVSTSNRGALYPMLSGRHNTEEVQQHDQWVHQLRESTIRIADSQWSLIDLLIVFWDSPFFYKEARDDYKRLSTLDVWMKDSVNNLFPALLALAHGEVSGSEKQSVTCRPRWPDLFHSSAFGYERKRIDIWNLASKRRYTIDHLVTGLSSAVLNYAVVRKAFIGDAVGALNEGVGDTQWPYNEITLWDYASSIATLFKSTAAKAVLEGRLPTVAEVKWRLLSIRYDGLEYLSRAHHISDLLARRQALEAALDEVRAVIEVEYPLGNEIYRDENGSVLLVPHVQDADQDINLLEQECGAGSERKMLEELLNDRFSGARYDEAQKREPLGGEVRPMICLSDSYLGKQINLAKAPGWKNPILQPDPAKVNDWWSDEKKRGEVCTVCNLRPQGYGAPDGRHDNGKKGWNLHLAERHQEKHYSELDPEDCEVCKAQSRQICWVCLERRDDRSRKWASDVENGSNRTIWPDEVADEYGRLALVVARFVLGQWLDGTLIPTMQKSASFARIQRCWRTTLEFWQEIEQGRRADKNEEGLPDWIVRDSTRLSLIPDDTNLNLGDYHVYDLELGGQYLSAVWTGTKFLTADNLNYFEKNSGTLDSLDGKTVNIYEPAAHLSHRKSKASITIHTQPHKETYSPFIPILAQPSLFMALIPGNQGLEVAQRIKEKYEKQMGKVRDRLPLHIGLVFAPRRTPVRALLEAGRRMLKMPEKWESINVEHIDHDAKDHKVTLANGAVWKIPAVMGDGTTPDQWYPHLLKREPMTDEDLSESKPWDHAKDLQVRQPVCIRPSRFDFEFLDTTARRFEISYDSNGRRRGSANRPFLLEDLSKLNDLWDLLVGSERTNRARLSTSHLQHLEGALTGYINDWFNGDVARAKQCSIYQMFATDTLHQLDKDWWKGISEDNKVNLDDAVKSGLILDLLDLRMHILKEKSPMAMKGGNL